MPKTYTTSAIILNRQPFRENDTRVVVYSLEEGRLDLVARGTRKLTSKLAGHLEPLSATDLMVVKGRQYDYIGSAACGKSFGRLKSDPAKVSTAGYGVRYFASIVKQGVEDSRLFDLLLAYLCLLDERAINARGLDNYFILRLLGLLGFVPELYRCLGCGKPLQEETNYFAPGRGGLCCPACGQDSDQISVCPEAVKILRLACRNDLFYSSRLKTSARAHEQVSRVVDVYSHYIRS